MVLSEVHPSNADASIEERFEGRLMETRAEHPLNAELWMIDTEEGRANAVKESDPDP